MSLNVIRCFVLSLSLFPAVAFPGVACDYPAQPFCIDFSWTQTNACVGEAVAVASCSTASSLGTCTVVYPGMADMYPTYTTKTFWYPRNGMTQDAASYFSQSCASGGGTWSAGSGGPTTTTPLPSPPTSQTAYSAPNGQLPAAAVQVAASGTYGSAKLNVSLNVAQALQAGRSGRAAAAYNVYVAALVPGALVGSANPVFYVKPKAPGSWAQLQWPMASFLQNVAQSAVDGEVLVEILDNMNIVSLVGTEIYIGYGTSDQEMLAANRYRGVYKVQ